MDRIEHLIKDKVQFTNTNIDSDKNSKNNANIKNKYILRKLKEKNKTISITSVITITGLLNLPNSIKTTTLEQFIHQDNIISIHQNNMYIQMKALREYISLKNPDFQIGEMDRLLVTLLKESKELKLPESARINNKQIDPLIFLLAMIETESSFNKFAISISNARGYMQIMPQTALWIKNKEFLNISINEIHSTEINIMLGVKYLNYLSTQFSDVKWICLAYNAGEANVKKGYYDINYWIKVQKFYIEIEEFLEQYQTSIQK